MTLFNTKMILKKKIIHLLLKSLLIAGTVASMTITLLLLFRDYQMITEEEYESNRIGYKRVSNVRLYNRMYSSDRQFYPRAKLMTSVNTILREMISLSNLIGGVRESHYLTQTSGISLAIIWISTHLDNGVELLYTTSLFITSHVLQFFLVMVSLWFAYLIQEENKQKTNDNNESDVREESPLAETLV